MVRAWRLFALLAAFTSGSFLGTAAEVKGAKKRAEPGDDLLGKPAPETTGEFALNGKAVKISDLKGKVVLLDYWTVWCPPCVRAFPHLTEWHKTYHKDGLEIVGITPYQKKYAFDKEKGELTSLDPDNYLSADKEHEMLMEFTAYHKLEHRLMTVSKADWEKLREDYKSRGLPTFVLIDRKGLVRLVKVGVSEENDEELTKTIKELLAEK